MDALAGLKVLELGHAYLSSTEFPEMVEPILDRLKELGIRLVLLSGIAWPLASLRGLPWFGRSLRIAGTGSRTPAVVRTTVWSLLGLAGWRYSKDLITDDDVLSILARQKDLNFRPGERHLYSNSGYTLLAIIVSRVSGKTFREMYKRGHGR